MWVFNDTKNSRNDKNGVSDHGDENGPHGGHISSQVGVGDITTEKWNNINPFPPYSKQGLKTMTM